MKKPKTKPKASSVQALLGMQRFTEYGVQTANGEIVIFRLQPINISVLSPILVEQRLDALTKLIIMLPNIEFVCCDSQQNFSDNKLHLQKRASEESCEAVKELLRKDEAFLDDIQSSMATAREFLCLLRLKKDDGLATIIDVEKKLSSHGFAPVRLNKDELKGLIARYFGYYTEIPLPDYDGL